MPWQNSYVLGADAMKKMSQSNVLIIGCEGLGLEIGKHALCRNDALVPLSPPCPRTCSLPARSLLAPCSLRAAKNVALAGVKSLTIHDDQPTVLADLTTQVSHPGAALPCRRLTKPTPSPLPSPATRRPRAQSDGLFGGRILL